MISSWKRATKKWSSACNKFRSIKRPSWKERCVYAVDIRCNNCTFMARQKDGHLLSPCVIQEASKDIPRADLRPIWYIESTSCRSLSRASIIHLCEWSEKCAFNAIKYLIMSTWLPDKLICHTKRMFKSHFTSRYDGDKLTLLFFTGIIYCFLEIGSWELCLQYYRIVQSRRNTQSNRNWMCLSAIEGNIKGRSEHVVNRWNRTLGCPQTKLHGITYDKAENLCTYRTGESRHTLRLWQKTMSCRLCLVSTLDEGHHRWPNSQGPSQGDVPRRIHKPFILC